MTRLKIDYDGTNTRIINLDTGIDLVQNNSISRLVVDFNAKNGPLPKVTIDLVPEEIEIVIDGKIVRKVRTAKLK